MGEGERGREEGGVLRFVCGLQMRRGYYPISSISSSSSRNIISTQNNTTYVDVTISYLELNPVLRNELRMSLLSLATWMLGLFVIVVVCCQTQILEDTVVVASWL